MQPQGGAGEGQRLRISGDQEARLEREQSRWAQDVLRVHAHKQKGRRSKGCDSHGVKTGAAPVSGTHVTSAGDDENKIKILRVYGPREISEIII